MRALMRGVHPIRQRPDHHIVHMHVYAMALWRSEGNPVWLDAAYLYWKEIERRGELLHRVP